jgi:probable HAF family extracellular repeat protein
LSSEATGINNSGQIVGFFVDATVHGFFLDVGGSFTTIDVPGATSTSAFGINDSGQIMGIFFDTTGTSHGFLLDTSGSITTIDVPGASGRETFARGINNSGQIVGYFGMFPTGGHGFLYTGGSFTSIDVDVPHLETFALGINNSGQIVGSFDSSDAGPTKGFLATPTVVPESRSLRLLALRKPQEVGHPLALHPLPVEEIVPTDRLRLVLVLDLHPGRSVWSVAGVCLLRHDALHVPLTDNAEQVRAARDVIHVQN